MTDVILSPETIRVLKNFSSINQSILVTPGNTLRTLSLNNVILGKYDAAEKFETEWAIYNMPEFLSALELFEQPELTFKQKSVNIQEATDKKKNIVYQFADAEIVHTTAKSITMPETPVNFTLPEAELNRFLKTASVLQSPHFVISNSDNEGMVSISVMDVDNPATNVYSADISAEGDVPGKTFKLIFKVENLMVIPGEYSIGISDSFLSHWMMDDLEYWIALETSSVYGK